MNNNVTTETTRNPLVIFFGKLLSLIKNIDWTKVSAGTISRYVCAGIVALNQILTLFNINPIPISDNKIYEAISVILSVIILIMNTYKDNPTSKEAIVGHNITQHLKSTNTAGTLEIIEQVSDGSWVKVGSANIDASEEDIKAQGNNL